MRRTMPIPDTITVHVPFRLVKRGGRKEMVLPVDMHVRPKADDTLVKALARAFRWKLLLETGAFVTIGDLADHEKIVSSYLTRILRLTLLAPDIVEGIVEGRGGLGLAQLLEPFPVEWSGQIQLQEEDAAIRL